MTGSRDLTPRRVTGLRTRVGLALAATAVLVPALLALTLWFVVTSYLVSQRERLALAQAESNVAVVERALGQPDTPIPEVLNGLPRTTDTAILLRHRGGWYGTSVAPNPDALPKALTQLVMTGTAASQRVSMGGTPVLVIGLPMTETSYLQVFPLTELDETHRTLSTALVGVSTLAAAAGVFLGRAAGRRALAPLSPVIEATKAIADGNLATRLDGAGDPDLDEVATAFNRTAERLQRRVAADERFAGDVSHEMRTTLMAMLNAFELVESGPDLPPASREAFVLLGTELRRFSVMVEELLEISRAGEGDVGLVLEQVIIGDLVAAAADRTAGRQVTHISPSIERLRMRVDKRRIERVVTNLVHNAEVHGNGVVQVAVEPYAHGARIFVDDAGPGVAPDRRERIFERFATETAGGVGLGLSIVARHVHQHGGSVWVGDRPGGGARFIVELPEERA
ncbi:histidine kinase [Knoellia sinensis KCTC 19936]|uniref:histidine kinase n=1 Tax=Knoellia sinensis KCTC 19936 TaxID=1385520 RepID=A0A0A0J714_9MICO|nr:HAMP domain-containing sensor histidine kinase [Knoellia sinensis]KGN32963.1 histidine kinase [Knoellia sinensis KCTC 19936]